MNKWLSAAILIAFISGSAFGQARGPDTESRKTVNGFGSVLMLTKKPEEFVRDWTTSQESKRVTIQTAKDVRVGEHIAALAFFWGCRSSSAGCIVYADFELVAPDGSIRHRVPDRNGTTQSQPKSELVYLSQAIVRFQFEPNDPRGLYKINATVREPATGNVVRVSEQFRLVK